MSNSTPSAPSKSCHAHLGGASPSIPNPNTKVDPCTDFYTHVNKKWHAHIHLLPYQGSMGVSEEIEHNVRTQLLKTIQDLIKSEPTHPISLLATSFLHTASQKNSILDLQRVCNTFDCIASAEDVAESIGSLNKIQARAPLQLVVASDSYKNAECCIYLYEPVLGLPEKKYYDPKHPNSIILKYARMLKEVGKMLNIESLESMIPIESTVMQYLSEGNDLANLSYSYNPCGYRTLTEKYAHVAWDKMFEAWGLDKETYTKARFVVTNTKYMTAFNLMFKSFTLDTWRIWMRAMTILSFIEYLPPPYDDLHFDLYGKALKGNSEKLPQKYLMLKVLQTYASQDLGRLFVAMNVEKGTKTHATRLVHLLKQATVERIENLKWMESSTKHQAIEKIRSMRFQVAYPDKWTSETAVVPIDKTRPLYNIFNLMSYDTGMMLNDLRRKECTKSENKWEDGAFEVNAYYYPEGNMMVIPAGILQEPFFDLKKSDAWNLGGIGAAIGHEITHGFDAEGRMYDAEGNYKNWWSSDDSRTFNKLTKDLVKLFDGQPYMGGKVDGTLTLSENLSDLGGLAIALHALKSQLPKSPEKQKEAYREFFTSYGVSWRNKDRPKKAKQSLLLDNHAPAPLRVNLIVRQFEEFYTAFDIPPTHPHYIPPEERILLW